MSYHRPHPVRSPELAARRLLDARRELLELLVGADAPAGITGELAVTVSNAIETLEAAAENYGAVRLDDSPPYVPVSREELAAVRDALREHHAQPCPCSVCTDGRFGSL